jgi:muramoyltetrapeptide carboxypeptidase
LAGAAVVLAACATRCFAAESATPAPLFPRALAPGDTIMFIAPAKYLDNGRVALAKQRLEELGFHVKLPENLFRKRGFLAGSDEQRAAELMAAFADPDVDAIFPGTGGYGTTRIVDKLDYDLIRRNPKLLVGFSDITALHIAINQRTGLVTFHSPNPEWGLGTENNLSPHAARWFWRAILAKRYFDPLAAATSPGYTIDTRGKSAAGVISDADAPPPAVTLVAGKSRGRLIGGNLSVLHALMGTPYEIQTDGRILFLEDVGEAPYRVDRMLGTLRLAGKFDRVAGVVLGHFTAREDEQEWDDDATINDVLRDYFAKLRLPVLMNFPVGHVRFNTTLPVGVETELDATNGTIRLLENPVAVP